jgi:hypothetical protein
LIIDFDRTIPDYLNKKGNIVKLILFTSVFALVFINIYSPFGVDKWFDFTPLQFLLFSSLVILTGVLIVVISRIIMYYISRKYVIKIWHYLIWILAEILFMGLFYTIFEKSVLKDSRDFIDLVKISARNTALVLLFPYSVLWLYFSWRDKMEQIERMGSDVSGQGTEGDMIAFYDEKQILRFSVTHENLLYIESAENYVNICYLNKGKVSKYLLRDTLKRVEEKHAGKDLVRCHRSYIVNFERVKVIRKDHDGLKLEIDSPETIDIPVSKTYIDDVMNTFSKYFKKPD